MSTVAAAPFLTPRGNTVRVQPWHWSQDGARAPLPNYVPGWDYAMALELDRSYRMNPAGIRSDCLLPDDAVLCLVVTAATGPGRLGNIRIPVTRHRLGDQDHEIEIPIEITLPGEKLSQNLHLETDLILESEIGEEERKPLAPWRAGSRLWRDRHSFILEGDGSRFPMEFISFSESFDNPSQTGALWFLHWSPSTEHLTEFRGGVRLYLNSDNEEFRSRVLAGDRLTLWEIMHGVMIQILSAMLADEHFIEEDSEYDEGSIGMIAIQWLTQALPGQSRKQVADMLINDPSHFHAAINSLADPGEEV